MRSAPLWMCISYTSRSLALVRLHSRVMPSRLAGSRLTAAAKAHAQMHQCPPAWQTEERSLVSLVLALALTQTLTLTLL